jgi:hypothetical protein
MRQDGHCIGPITCQRGGKPDIWDSSHRQLPRSANTAELIPWTSKWVILGIIGTRQQEKKRSSRSGVIRVLFQAWVAVCLGRGIGFLWWVTTNRLQKCGIPDRDVSEVMERHYITLRLQYM